LPIVVVSNPHVKTRKELLELAQKLRKPGITATIVIGNLRLDPEEYVRVLPNPYFLSGAEDDIRVTKQARKLNALLDGNVVEIGNVVVAGVGGVDPHQNMERVLRLLRTRSLGKRVDVTLSYHPPRGCGDFIKDLRLRKGLDELRDFIKAVNPMLHVCGGEYVDTCSVNGTAIYALGKGASYLLIEKNHGSLNAKVFRLR